jgi:Ca2+-binding EF-hand superfamily protein
MRQAISVWDFLTCDLNTFIFHLYDHNDSGSITGEQFEQLVHAAYRMRPGENEKLDNLIRSKDVDRNGMISFQEFVDSLHCNKSIQFPGK